MSIDWQARSIVNQAIRTASDSHVTLLMEKSLGWDLGLNEMQIARVLETIEHETDCDIIEFEEPLDVTVGELYKITKEELN